jgi:hypothetical protein
MAMFDKEMRIAVEFLPVNFNIFVDKILNNSPFIFTTGPIILRRFVLSTTCT